MSVSEVKAVVGDTKHMSVVQATRIRDLMRENGVKDVLELGFYMGVSTCYMADMPGVHVTTIDLEAMEDTTKIEHFLDKLGLSDRVTIFYEPTSYTWRLMKMLTEDPTPRFDLVYLDGAHDWFTDGFAFFLADKLLRPGGWIVFDDIPWSYVTSPTWMHSERVRDMPIDERETQQVRKVFDLLAKTHPNYDNFREEGQWGFAHKALDTMTNAPARLVRVTETEYVKYGLGAFLAKLGKRLKKRVQR